MRFIVLFRNEHGGIAGYGETDEFIQARDLARNANAEVLIPVAEIDEFRQEEATRELGGLFAESPLSQGAQAARGMAAAEAQLGSLTEDRNGRREEPDPKSLGKFYVLENVETGRRCYGIEWSGTDAAVVGQEFDYAGDRVRKILSTNSYREAERLASQENNDERTTPRV
jgi:hypothetical protein